MGEIFRASIDDVPWYEYTPSAGEDGQARIRVKAMTLGAAAIPGVQYVEYAPGYVDPVHRHDTSEFFIVLEGELWLDDIVSGAGSVVFIPRETDYAVRAGDTGVRYYRVVVEDGE